MSAKHRLPRLTYLFVSFLTSTNTLAASTAKDWANVSTPTGSPSPSASLSIGSYTNGCLSGAAILPLQGPGYQVMRLSRNRYYGHAALVQFIQQLGLEVADKKLGTLLVGDLGQPRGGPTLSGHRSHQTGLDVDIWFLLSLQANQRLLTAQEREDWSATSVVNEAAETVDHRQWSPNHAYILEITARHAEVERVFVNPSIKQELCKHKTAASAAWLGKIRPWWKHDDHFHVRLKCPANNRDCQSQEPLPVGDGCDASLAWWFSAEAKTPSKTQTPPAPTPPLPWQCEQLIREPGRVISPGG